MIIINFRIKFEKMIYFPLVKMFKSEAKKYIYKEFNFFIYVFLIGRII
jgi:hypothetical protein